MKTIRQAASVFANSILALLPWVKRPWLPNPSYGAIALIVCIFFSIQVICQILQLRGSWYFNDYGLGAIFGNLGLAAGCCSLALFSRQRISFASAFAFSVSNMAVFSLLITLAGYVLQAIVAFKFHVPGATGWIIWLILIALTGFAAFRCGKAISGIKSNRAGAIVMSATVAGIAVLPFVPLIGSEDNYERTDLVYLARWAFTSSASISEAENNRPPAVDWERVMTRQTELVASSLAKIQDHDPSTPHTYFIGMAPYSRQKVFERELGASRQIFEHHFNAANRSILLQNADDTRETLPLASVTNLQQVAEGLAQKIDKENDVVVLFITSHGSKEQLAVEDYPLPLNYIKPQDIRYALSLTGARNRVVIISACYSGSFIKSLRDENTIIITAADEDHTSFGCSNDREWTYFTNAFFNHALRQTRDLKAAFVIASDLVKKWEGKMKIEASHPQIFIGEKVDRTWQKIMPSFDKTISTPTASTEDAL